MLRKKGHKTLREEIEALRGEKKKPIDRCVFYIFVFLLLLLVIMCFPGYIVFIEGTICLISLFQYMLTSHRPKNEKTKLQNRYKKKVRMLPWAILAIYFAFFAVVLTVYGVSRYILQMPMAFIIWEWIEKSSSVLLLFEIAVLQLNVRIERKD